MTDNPPAQAARLVAEMQAHGARLLAAGAHEVGHYLRAVGTDDVVNLRQARSRFSRLVDRAAHAPQVVTILGRRGAPDRHFVIMSESMAAKMADAVVQSLEAIAPAA